ncbi:MAG: tRNA dihydrouridine synthase DusB [bacterium]
MADLTDSAFCQTVKSFGVDVVFREMVSAEALVRSNSKTEKMAEFVEFERPIVLQIFGAKPETMAKAARILCERLRPDGIDINMGCPATKIVGNFNGAALMNEPELAAAIVKNVKAAVDVPLSVKTRLGWKDKTQILDFAKTLEAAGADLLTIHARTKAQGYSGAADWSAVRGVKETLAIPVLVNGDVVDAASAKRALSESGADGILIGRGALGRPWIFKEIRAGLAGNDFHAPDLFELATLIGEHAKLHLALHGPDSLMSFRKHLIYYLKGLPEAKQWREACVKVSTLADLELLLAKLTLHKIA